MNYDPPIPPSASGPDPFGEAAGAEPSSHVADSVRAPATTLLVITAVAMVLAVLGIILNIIGMGLVGAVEGAADTADGARMLFQGTVGLIQGLVGLVFGSVIIVGCLKMRKLESYGFAMTVNILSMVPCVSPCCLLGFPIGIWGLVVLSRPEVKAAFRS